MKKLLLSSVMVTGVVTMLTGCVVTQPFKPKELNENAKGITTVRSTPYGCKVLGEVEGMDEDLPHSNAPTLEEARKGALNDLRNNAAEVVGKTKRVTLRIMEEKAVCFTPSGNCDPDITDATMVKSFRVAAQVFECGEKE